MNKKQFILGVDLDGVCGDFYGSMRVLASEWQNVPLESLTEDVTYGLKEWGFETIEQYKSLHRFAVVERSFFRNLKPIPGAAATLRKLDNQHNIRIRIITHRLFIPHFHKTAVDQTVQWLDNHGFPYWDLCFMREKAAVGADLYIEDDPSNVEALRKGDHETIVFSNSTNSGVSGPRANNWTEVETLVNASVTKWSKEQH